MENRRKRSFRDYKATSSLVKDTYQKMQENQDLSFVRSMKSLYTSPSGYQNSNKQKIRKRLIDVFAELDKIIDESDPDTGLPQIYHAYQTAEALKSLCIAPDFLRIKKIPVKNLFSQKEWDNLSEKHKKQFETTLDCLYPEIQDWSWLPLIGFLHDLGKVLALKEWGELPQWAVVGDTFPVGAPFSSSNVYSEHGFFSKNVDLNSPSEDKSHFGRYKKHCGFEQLEMSFGHDEYCYSVIKRAIHHLPPEALYIIRFHSFYPWHTPRNGVQGYTELANEFDWKMLPLLKVFQQSDLYSKKAEMPDPEKLKRYYVDLIEKFIPGRVSCDYHLRPAKLLW